jgi:hypothetical protein
MMMLVDLTDTRNALHRCLVTDVAAQRVTRVGRVYDDAAAPDDLNGLTNQARLRVLGMNLEKLARHDET